MTCKLIRTLLADYSAQRLAPSETGEIRRHLDACNACTLFYNEEAALARGLERLPKMEPSADLWSRVALELDSPETQKARSRRFAWPWGFRSVAALATGAVATVGLVAYTQFNAPSAPVTGGVPPVVANGTPHLIAPSDSLNPAVDDPMADQMDTLFAAMDQITQNPSGSTTGM